MGKKTTTGGITYLLVISFSGLVVVGEQDPVLSGVMAVVAVFAGLNLIARVLAIRRSPINWPPSEWSSTAKVVASSAGMRVLDCGCAYVVSSRSNRSRLPDYEDVESERFWVRRDDGAKWRYEPWQETLVRCEHCGRHRYRRQPEMAETAFASDPGRSVWKDEEQPTFEHEVRDAEFVEEAL